jgi:hypothetical protein
MIVLQLNVSKRIMKEEKSVTNQGQMYKQLSYHPWSNLSNPQFKTLIARGFIHLYFYNMNCITVYSLEHAFT